MSDELIKADVKATYMAKVIGYGIFDMEKPKFYPDAKIELGSYLGCNYLLDDSLFEKEKDSIDIVVSVEVSDVNANIIHTDQWSDTAYKARQNQALYMAEAPHEVIEGTWKFTVSNSDKVLFEQSFYLKKASVPEEINQEDEYIEDNFDEEFEDDTQKQILVDVNSIESIRSALQKYKKLIESECFMGEYDLVVEFVDEDGDQLDIEADEDEDQLNIVAIDSKEIENAFNEYGNFSYGGISNEDSFFAYALKYEDLKKDVLEVLFKIIDYARRKNDTSDLWADDDSNVIGLGSIYAFAKLYPEYTYLLGLYMIPYWDDEHAPYAIDCVESLATGMGINRDTIKLFCYCDHLYLRENIFDNMTEYFRENKEEYEYFKDTLKQRFKEYPYLQYSSNHIIEKPVDQFYISLLCDRYNWYDGEDSEKAEFSDFFVYDSADIEANLLAQEIEEYIAKPLVEKSKDKNEKKRSVHPFVAWEEFIFNEIVNGEVVWKYITSGDNKESLNNLHSKYPNFYKLVKNSSYDLKEFIPDWMKTNDQLFRDIDQFTSKMFEWLQLNYTEVANGYILRIVDFLFEIYGRKGFEEYFINELIDEYKVITTEEFNIRYPQPIKQRVEKELSVFFRRGSVRNLNKLKNSICELEKQEPQSLTQIYDEIFYPKNEEIRELNKISSMLLLFAWGLRDFANANYAFMSLTNHLVDTFVDAMTYEVEYDADKEIWEKVKQDILNAKEVSLDDCKKLFKYDDDYEFTGLDFHFLNVKWIKNTIRTMFLVVKNNYFTNPEILNILSFMISLNPVGVINTISKVHRVDYNEEIDLNTFTQTLRKIHISELYIKAWQAHYYYDTYEEKICIEYVTDLLENYKDQFEEILSYLFEEEKIYFFELAKKIDSKVNFLDDSLYKIIKTFTKQNIDSIPTRAYKNRANLNPIYDGSLLEYTGDIFTYPEVKNFNVCELEDGITFDTNDEALMIYMGDEKTEIYGRYYLMTNYLNFKSQLDGSERLVILDNYGDEILSADICEDIDAYLKGEIEFDEVKKYQSYFNKEYLNEGTSNYRISDAFLDMDTKLRKRFLRFYLPTSMEMYKLIFKALFNKAELLEETLDMVSELGLSFKPIVSIFIGDKNYDEELVILSKKIDLVSVIKEYSEANRIEAIKTLDDNRSLRNHLRSFVDDKSRVIRDMAQKYDGVSQDIEQEDKEDEEENLVKPDSFIVTLYNKLKNVIFGK